MGKWIGLSVAVATLFGVSYFGCTQSRAAPEESGRDASAAQKLVIRGESRGHGIADASVEYGPDGVGWLAYSWVELPASVDTHIARSTDGGKTWTYVGAPNTTQTRQIAVGGRKKKKQGFDRYETSSLLYDATDREDRRWKLFVERYPTVPPHKAKDNLHHQGVIEMRHARTPKGPWSEPVCILGSRAEGCSVDPNDLHRDLHDMAMYNEIGSIAVDGVIYLSLDASTSKTGLGQWDKRRVILVASRDHGKAWSYTGTLTDGDDAKQLGYFTLTASSLVRSGGKLYLLVTPAGARKLFTKNRRHNGTLVIQFEDITTGRLTRDSKGRLVVARHTKPFLTSGGQADYDEGNSEGGVVFAQFDLKGKPEFFKLYQSRRPLLP